MTSYSSSFSKIVSHTKKESSCALNAAIMGVILNLILPEIANMFPCSKDIDPGTFKGQMMHMLMHQRKTKFTSSIIIFAIVYLAVLIGYTFKIF